MNWSATTQRDLHLSVSLSSILGDKRVVSGDCFWYYKIVYWELYDVANDLLKMHLDESVTVKGSQSFYTFEFFGWVLRPTSFGYCLGKKRQDEEDHTWNFFDCLIEADYVKLTVVVCIKSLFLEEVFCVNQLILHLIRVFAKVTFKRRY